MRDPASPFSISSRRSTVTFSATAFTASYSTGLCTSITSSASTCSIRTTVLSGQSDEFCSSLSSTNRADTSIRHQYSHCCSSRIHWRQSWTSFPISRFSPAFELHDTGGSSFCYQSRLANSNSKSYLRSLLTTVSYSAFTNKAAANAADISFPNDAFKSDFQAASQCSS